MKKIIVSILFAAVVFPAFTQEVFVIDAGSMADLKPKAEEMDKQSLDMATVRAYYYFTQKEKATDKSAFRKDTMTLDIGLQMSHYYDATKPRKDSLNVSPLDKINPSMIKSVSILKDSQADGFDNFIGEKYAKNYFDGTSEKIYKNRINGQITIIDKSSDFYRCDDPVGSLNWEITPDTATIFNYNCQKAKIRFRGRDYEAWFAPEVPINDGPWKFFGLPGLIVKVNDTAGLVAFECVGLQYLDNPYEVVIPEGKYIKCNRKELEKVIRNRGASLNIAINGGNVVIAGKSLSPSFKFLELE
jgi:GLPGLI family protein